MVDDILTIADVLSEAGKSDAASDVRTMLSKAELLPKRMFASREVASEFDDTFEHNPAFIQVSGRLAVHGGSAEPNSFINPAEF